MARLVAAQCPKCGAGVKLDPASEFVTCTYCGTSSFIETKKRPVTQQVAQAHYPVIHVKQPSAAIVVVPIILVTLLIIGGSLAGVFFSMRQTMQSLPKVSFNQSSQSQSNPNANSRGLFGNEAEKPAPQVNFFADATSVLPAFSKSIGTPLNVTELVIYPEYAILTAQNPKNTEHIDRYTYRDGDVSEGDAVRMSGSSKDNLKKELFDLSTVDFSKVPLVVADALQAIPLEDGKATHIIVDRLLPWHKDVRFRVYVSGPRDSGGYVMYTLTGQRKDVMK